MDGENRRGVGIAVIVPERWSRTGRSITADPLISDGRALVGCVISPAVSLSHLEGLPQFALAHVYGGSGNRFRHGNAPDRWQRWSLMLTFALATWLVRRSGHAERDIPEAYDGTATPANMIFRAFLRARHEES